MTPRGLSRREFLRLSAMAQLAVATLGCGEQNEPATTTHLRAACLAPEAARVVGAACLQLEPALADPAALAAAIRKDHPTLFDVPDDRLPDALREAVRRDFEADHIVDVQGWLLSRTEARLAALVSLG